MNGGTSTTKTQVMKYYLKKNRRQWRTMITHILTWKCTLLKELNFVFIFLWLHAIHQYKAADMISKFPLLHQSRAADPLIWSNREFQTCFENVFWLTLNSGSKWGSREITQVLFFFTVNIFNLLIYFKINKKQNEHHIFYLQF